MRDTVSAFREEIEKAGLTPPVPIIADGKLHRFASNGDRADDAGWYTYFPDEPPAGVFGCWRKNFKQTWSGKADATLTAAERERQRTRFDEARRQREHDERLRQVETAKRAQTIWDRAKPARNDHPYLQNKQIQPHGLRLDGEHRLMVPVTIDGVLSSLQFIDANGGKLFLPGGKVRGGRFTLGALNHADTLLLAEGFATGASLYEATGFPVVVAFSANNLTLVAQQLRHRYPTATIIVCGDHDLSGTGQWAARAAAEAVNGMVALPEVPGQDFNDVQTQHGLDAVKEAIAAAIRREETRTMRTDVTTNAGEPAAVLEPAPPVTVIPLDEVRLPDLTLDTFPDPLGPMIDAVAKATETPVELPALMGLATVAASCQQVFDVEMEPGYLEPLCVWAIAALQSGNRKTAVHNAMTNPLRKKERALCETVKAQRVTIESERATIEARVKGLRSRLANSEDSTDIERMKREITELETTMPDLPAMPSLWAQDVTPEKLGTMMADNGERLAILSDEGGFFDILTGRYSNGIPNLDTCLQGHSCSPVKVNRGGRDEVHMQRPTLTMGLSPQPSVLRDLTSKSILRDRGFLARVLFALPTSRLGFRTLQSHPIPPVIETAYHRMVEALLAFHLPTNEDGQLAAYRLKPSPEAHREWKEFARTVERDMRPGAQYEHMTDWAGKLPGEAVRVAGLFHCVQHCHAQPHTVPISLDTMQRALGVLAVLSQHALAVFDLMGADPALDGARKVWRWIEQGRRPAFRARECFQGLSGTFHRMANLDPALTVLCERGYLIEEEVPRTGPGRPSRVYSVNPTLTQGWI